MKDGKEEMADIVAEMMVGPIPHHTKDRELLAIFADRIAAAQERQRAEWEAKTLRELGIAREELREEYRRIYGNGAELRAALECVKDRIGGWWEYLEVEDEVEAALAAPCRNCDMFKTAEEAMKAFDEMCDRSGPCDDGKCKLRDGRASVGGPGCVPAWLFALADPAPAKGDNGKGEP